VGFVDEALGLRGVKAKRGRIAYFVGGEAEFFEIWRAMLRYGVERP